MIYNTNNDAYTEYVALFGEEADELLEALDIELRESTIAIGENVYDGATAERFLNENGILLYEDHIVLEGKQAEEYKSRKAAEKKKAEDEEDTRYDNRYLSGKFVGHRSSDSEDNSNEHNSDKKYNKDIRTDKVAKDIYFKEWNRRFKKSTDALDQYKKYADSTKNRTDDASKRKRDELLSKAEEASKNTSRMLPPAVTQDATNRHVRRHPKQYKESTIFDFDIK